MPAPIRHVPHRPVIITMPQLIAAGFGRVHEIYEWTSDGKLGTHYQPNNTDTMTDILVNDMGGRIGGLWLTVSMSRAREGRCRHGTWPADKWNQ